MPAPRIFLPPILVLILSLFSSAAEPAVAEARKVDLRLQVREQANRCAQAMIRHDLETFAPFVSPRLLQAVGGRTRLVELIEKGREEMKKKKVVLTSAEVGTPSTVEKAAGFYLSMVPQRVIMTGPEGRSETTSHLLAISSDEGKSWYFLDCASLDQEKLDLLYPELKGKIRLPQAKTQLLQ